MKLDYYMLREIEDEISTEGWETRGESIMYTEDGYDNKYYRSANRIMSAGIRNPGLAEVMRVAAKELNADMVVSDSFLCPLGWSFSQEVGDPIWEELAGKNLVPPLNWMSNLHSLPVLFSDMENKAYHWKSTAGNDQCLLVKLRCHGKNLGYLSICGGEDCPLRRQLVMVLSAVLVMDMTTEGGYVAKDSVFEHCLVAMIEDKFHNEWDLEEVTRETGLKSNGIYTLVVVNFPRNQTQERSRYAFQVSVEQALYVTRSTVYQKHIVLILSASSIDVAESRDYSALTNLLEEADTYAAVSRTYTSISNTCTTYNGISKMLSRCFCAPSGVRILTAENMGISYVVDALLRIETPQDLIDPRVHKLIQYDQLNGSTYVETLLAYLQNSRKPTLTSAALNIHRNTLDYRLQKIDDLVGIDWTNGDLCFRIYLSLNVYYYCQKRTEQSKQGYQEGCLPKGNPQMEEI